MLITPNAPTTDKWAVLGVDPGLSGAISIVSYNPSTPLNPYSLDGVWDMPLTSPNRTNGKRDINPYELSMLIGVWAPRLKLAVIEKVGTRPGEGVVSSFRFGESLGLVSGIVASNMIPIQTPLPAVWKPLMGLGREKELSLHKVSELFPKSTHQWRRKKDHGRAEAVLLAVFGIKHFYGVMAPKAILA